MKKLCVLFLLFLFSLTVLADDDDKQKLAVMEFEDLSKTLSSEMLVGAAEYLRSAFANSNKFLLIAKERQEKAMIAEMKKESYKECNDKNCQIPLGQALSADTILRTTINFFGGVYTITSEFIDLAKEATVIAAKEKFDGSEKSLMEALDKIEEKITGFAKQKEKSDDEEEPEVKPAAAEEKAEVKPAETTGESKPAVETYRPYKVAGISLIAAGAVVVAGGVAAFHVLSDKEYNKYKDMAKSSNAASSSAANEDEYVKKADKHRKNSDTYRILEITSGAVGGALLVSGVVLTLIKKEKTDEKVSLSNFSVLPSNDGFYASLGFEF